MKIATWNVNSLGVRLPQVLAWLSQHEPDVLCLQELKLADAAFPVAEFAAAGWQTSWHGQKTYNGVALISRVPPQAVEKNPHWPEDTQSRVIAATYQTTRVVCVYVPNGQCLDSDKYHYKLAWLSRFSAWLTQQQAHYSRLVVAGDFNIAPTDQDVHDPARWAGGVLVSPAERAVWQHWRDEGFVDAIRQLYPDEPCFSWWDYRGGSLRRNHGLRIDHILLSPSCVVQAGGVDVVARQQERPSDHAPVWAVCH